MKVKDIKKKVSKKVAQGKAKVAKKCGRSEKVAAIAALVAALACITGCHMGEVPTAQRAQTANTEVRVYVYEGGKATFGNEFVSLAQANETAGTETMTATPHNAPVVDTKPDIDVTVPVKGSSGTTSGALETILGAAANKTAQALGTSSAASAAAPACVGGACSTCSDGSCTYGTCNE